MENIVMDAIGVMPGRPYSSICLCYAILRLLSSRPIPMTAKEAMMKMVTAIVRTTSLERIVKAIQRIGVRGMTISQIKGIGEQMTLNTPYSIHDKIEILVSDEKKDEVMNIILDNTKTGLPGDGLIAVFPVESLIKIRTCEKIHDGNCQNL